MVSLRVVSMQADLQKEVQRSKAISEAEGRIKEGRENEDVNRWVACWTPSEHLVHPIMTYDVADPFPLLPNQVSREVC